MENYFLDSETIKNLVVDALDDLKGRDIICMDISKISTIADYMIVATGTSSRHVKSLSEEVAKKIKDANGSIYGTEGQRQADWILVDLGDVVVHVMQEETRKMYDLESLWSMTPSSNG